MSNIREIDAAEITEAVSRLCIKANLELPQDVVDALHASVKTEDFAPAKETLQLLEKNLEIAAARNIPVCQDTGAACVFAEIGQDVHINGDFEVAVNAGVRKGYVEGYLRKSIVKDPVRRGNTEDNTPAFITTHLVSGDKIKLTVLPKGFGSENMSRVAMLKPADGLDGIKKFIIETVKLAGPNPCPPIVLGIGIGGTFDKVTALAKKALMRPLNEKNSDPFYAELEAEMLAEINKLGTGPQGFGGRTTCLGLAVEVMPTHVAGMPVAVNVSCHVTRRASVVL